MRQANDHEDIHSNSAVNSTSTFNVVETMAAYKYWVFGIVTAIFLAIGVGALLGQQTQEKPQSILLPPPRHVETLSALSEPESARGETYSALALEAMQAPKDIVVYLVGAIVLPGVYYVQPGTRLVTVVEMAGGFHEQADREAANLAMELKDGQRYRLPFLGDEAEDSSLSMSGNAPEGSHSQGKVNINTADISLLQTLPNIGPSRAQAIVDYRTKQGTFHVIDDIKRVSGIGDSIFAQISDRITVG